MPMSFLFSVCSVHEGLFDRCDLTDLKLKIHQVLQVLHDGSQHENL
jgi:hypothetical protein